METLIKENRTLATVIFEFEPRVYSKFLALSATFALSRFPGHEKSERFSIEHSCTTLIFTTQSLLDEIKPEVKEKHEFEYRFESKIKSLLLGTFVLQNFNSRIKVNNFSKNFICASVIQLIETLMDLPKPVGTEKQELKHRDKSILLAVFGIFEQQNSESKSFEEIFNRIPAHKVKDFDSDLDVRNQPCSNIERLV